MTRGCSLHGSAAVHRATMLLFRLIRVCWNKLGRRALGVWGFTVSIARPNTHIDCCVHNELCMCWCTLRTADVLTCTSGQAWTCTRCTPPPIMSSATWTRWRPVLPLRTQQCCPMSCTAKQYGPMVSAQAAVRTEIVCRNERSCAVPQVDPEAAKRARHRYHCFDQLRFLPTAWRQHLPLCDCIQDTRLLRALHPMKTWACMTTLQGFFAVILALVLQLVLCACPLQVWRGRGKLCLRAGHGRHTMRQSRRQDAEGSAGEGGSASCSACVASTNVEALVSSQN